MRSATAALIALPLALAALPARAGGSAEALGAAYRAFEAGDFARARQVARSFDRSRLETRDYALYVAAQSAYFLGEHREALRGFRELAEQRRSRFQDLAGWRVADCLWRLGQMEPARDAYVRLLRKAGGRRSADGDPAVARFRVAAASSRLGDRETAAHRFRRFLREHPAHALEPQARARLVEIVGEETARLTAEEQIERARRLTEEKKWHRAVAELSRVDGVSGEVALQRDFQLGMTLFSMRRHYQRAAEILLGIYDRLDEGADEALFHGARALSRADRDEEAIGWYLKVVEDYPRSRYAHEALFLAGWLHFNLGNYEKSLPILAKMRERYPRSRFAVNALWYQGLANFLLGDHAGALPHFEALSRRRGKLVGGKGHYWKARALQKLGRTEEANRAYRELVGRFPLTWYALLAQARLREQEIEISPLGDDPPAPSEAPPLDRSPDRRLARDPLIRAADELTAAGLGAFAGHELRRGERGFLRRSRPRSAALAVLMDRHRKAGSYHRPWVLAVVRGGAALRAPPEGAARIWWEHAYPLAFRELVERWRGEGNNPPYYLYAIMRKESGFDPHTHSYADARGLLQMIPPTTRRVVRELGLDYTRDMLFDPELNVRTGSWYIGRLLAKFKHQIPFGAGSYNSGPGPVMRWMRLHGDHPTDEFVELVSYSQTRNYMRRVTETYARYLYLYEGEVYRQPLEVDSDYLENDLTY